MFLAYNSYYLKEYQKKSLGKVVVLSGAELLVYKTWWYHNSKYDFWASKPQNDGNNHAKIKMAWLMVHIFGL